ncbi:MAG TPA: 2-hydroxyacid dehydrogenase [Anaerovoracaceae bacterium]|nr:2-hydroxyacid dehydrogenase [Anaerovoracaceae bacterium]
MLRKWKIAFLDIHTNKVKQIIRSHVPSGFILEMADTEEMDERKRLVKDADFIITALTPVTEELMRMAPNLKLIQKWGVGYDRIDIDVAREMGIGVAITLGSNAIPVAELAITLMQSVYRNIPFIDSSIREGKWLWLNAEMRDRSFMLHGKKIGLIGFGFIGRAVASILKGFSVEIIYFDMRRAAPEEEKEFNVSFVDFDELISSSDIISLHLPLNQHTRHLINKKNLQKMKPSAIIVNTARGGLIKESDLVWALENNIISGAGIDVLEEEPPSLNNPLFQLDNVVLTCHMGGVVIDNVSNMARHIFGNIEKVAHGQSLLERDIVVHPNKLIK